MIIRGGQAARVIVIVVALDVVVTVVALDVVVIVVALGVVVIVFVRLEEDKQLELL